MTHLRIELNTIAENVTSSVIHKLYETAKAIIDNEELNEVEESLVSLKGNLQVSKAYEDEVDWLEAKFPDLHINVTVGKYVKFQDPLVQSILAERIGDGSGVSRANIQSTTSFGGAFAKSNIQYFNELSQFNNITEINSNNRFNSCASLLSIDLSNITKISGSNGYERWNFESCSNLESVGNTSNLTYVGQAAFNSCSKLSTIDLSNVTYIGNGAFWRCSGLLSINNLDKCTSINSYSFCHCINVLEFVNLSIPNLEGVLYGGAFAENSQIINVVNLGKITSMYHTNQWGSFKSCSNILTVIIPETVTDMYYAFSGCSKIRWIKCLANQVPNIILDGVYCYNFGELWDSSGNYNGRTYPIYVKDSLYDSYLEDEAWGKIRSRLKLLSLFDTDFPNG